MDELTSADSPAGSTDPNILPSLSFYSLFVKEWNK